LDATTGGVAGGTLPVTAAGFKLGSRISIAGTFFKPSGKAVAGPGGFLLGQSLQDVRDGREATHFFDGIFPISLTI
jgi:hypothetical protein